MAGSTREPLTIGQKMTDGSIFVGLTNDNKQQIYAMPVDLGAIKSFNNAAGAVKKMNVDKTLGHNDWQIPTWSQLLVLHRNQDKGALKGTFNVMGAAGSYAFPDWYWSSNRDTIPSRAIGVRFSNGGGFGLEDNLRLSCRPVRLAAASGS